MSKNTKIPMKPTDINHIYLIDINDDGYLVECAVVKEWSDGSISYIRIDTLHAIDKARIKKVVLGPDADKYPLYELLSRAKMSNGLNGLDYCHSNFIKIKRPKGAALTTNSILSTGMYSEGDKMIGADFVNPAEVNLDTATRSFIS